MHTASTNGVTLLSESIPAALAAPSSSQPRSGGQRGRCGQDYGACGDPAKQRRKPSAGPLLAAHRRQDRKWQERRRRDYQIGPGPVRLGRDPHRAAARRDHRAAIAPQVRRHHRALLGLGGRKLDAPAVRRDLQRGGPERQRDREQRGQRQAGIAAGEGHSQHRGEDAELRQHDPPTPPPPEAPEAGHAPAFEQRRPQELEGRQQCDPGEEADHRDIDPVPRQPQRQEPR